MIASHTLWIRLHREVKSTNRVPPYLPACTQQGQALIYGIFMLIAGLAALFFLFNTGQLSQEKTKLVNTADAVAYSAGIMHARTLNYMAYTNRAMLANTVAIAQLVSLSSWIRYASTLPYAGASAAHPLKYPEFYAAYLRALYSGPSLNQLLIQSGSLKTLALTSDTIIQDALMNAQQTAFSSLPVIRQQVMREVAEANYRQDGSIEVDDVPLTGGQELEQFLHYYAGNERQRFAETAQAAAHLDGFVKQRSWKVDSHFFGDCFFAAATSRLDWLSRRGGTNLIGFNEWRAMDTLSEWKWKAADGFFDFTCSDLEETANGWGTQSAASNTFASALQKIFQMGADTSRYDHSKSVNPSSSAMAELSSLMSGKWNYRGIPSIYDLSETMLKHDDPRLQFAIRLRRTINQTMTSEGRSAIRPGDRLNAYQAQPAGGEELVAVSASEVFFERPPTAKVNEYGATIGLPGEKPSLFNPYWQVHLVYLPDAIKKAQSMQGVIVP